MYRQPSAQVYGITLHRTTCMTFMTFPFERNAIYNVHDITPGSTCTSEGLQIPYILVVKFFWFSATIHVTGPVYNKMQSGERNFLTFFHIYNLSLTFTSSLSIPTPSHTHILPVERAPVERDPTGFTLILLQRRVHQNHIELWPQGGEVKGPKVTLEVHWLRSSSLNRLVLQWETQRKTVQFTAMYTKARNSL